VSVTVNDYTRVFDLCDDCRQELVVPLTKAMADYGNLPSRPALIRKPYSKGETGHYPCTHPGCDKCYRHKSTLRTHVKQAHDMTLGDLYKRFGYGDTKRTSPPASGEYYCPECQADGKSAMFTRPQGLGMHRAKVHGVQSH
jgi:hypothetical protein